MDVNEIESFIRWPVRQTGQMGTRQIRQRDSYMWHIILIHKT